MLVFRQLFDPPSSTYTYLLADGESGNSGRHRPGVRAGQARCGVDRRTRPAARLYARNPCPCRPRHRRLVVAAADRVPHRAVGRQRRRGGRSLSGAGRRGSVWRAPCRSAGLGPYQWLPDLCARRSQHGLHRGLPADLGSGRTDFQQGDPHAMYRSVHQQIFTLPDEFLRYIRRTIIAG